MSLGCLCSSLRKEKLWILFLEYAKSNSPNKCTSAFHTHFTFPRKKQQTPHKKAQFTNENYFNNVIIKTEHENEENASNEHVDSSFFGQEVQRKDIRREDTFGFNDKSKSRFKWLGFARIGNKWEKEQRVK